MRQELTQLGVRELKTAAEVDAVLGGQRQQPGDQQGPTVMVVVNSVCGCAAGKARPGIALALQHETKPEIVEEPEGDKGGGGGYRGQPGS